MKKILFLSLAMIGCVCDLHAEAKSLEVMTGTVDGGNDRYADGTLAEVGEFYAVVWVKDGSTFHFRADGTWEDTDSCKLLKFFRTKFAGQCAADMGEECGMDELRGFPYQFQVQLSAADVESYRGGHFELHLLDTRYFIDKSKSEVIGSGYESKPTLVNVGSCVASVDSDEASDVLKLCDVVKNEISLVPEDAPRPVITGCRIVSEDGEQFFELTIKKTVYCLNYNISRGSTPTASDAEEVAVKPIEGSKIGVDEERTIRIPLKGNENCGFFKVIRQQPIKVEK